MFPFKLFNSFAEYDSFLDDLADRLFKRWNAVNEPEFISQRKAYKMFGRRNVERWRREGKITIYKRPGKVEYRLADLRRLQNTPQDYLSFKASYPDNKKLSDRK